MGGTDLGASGERLRLTLPAPIRRTDVPELCDRARDLIEGRHDEVLECDVEAVRIPDLVTVDALARVGLTARQLGGEVRLRGASVELLELLAMCGLPFELVLEAEGQTEQREEPRRVEEEGDSTDAVV